MNRDKFSFLILHIATMITWLSLNVFSQARCPNPAPITNDPVYSYPLYNGTFPRCALDSIFAYCAWSITKGCPDVIVGVVDTEFDLGHEDMINTFESVVGVRRRVDDHGTGVSSLVASATNNGVGMASIGYNTRIRGYHANGSGSGNGDSVWELVKQAYQEGIKIINISWASLYGYNNNITQRAYLQQMLNDGVVLVLGAGNDSLATDHQLYADFPGIINVSCVDSANRHRPTNSARNAWVDVCATSSPITVAVPSYATGLFAPEYVGNNVTGGYYLSGNNQRAYTSHAAPQVAGTIALMRSVNSFLSSVQIENIIKTTGDPIKDDSLFRGHDSLHIPRPKRVNAYEAVKEAKRLACGTTNTFSKTINTINESVNGGNVIISNTTIATGKRLSIRACNSVTINAPFIAEAGSMLNINVVP